MELNGQPEIISVFIAAQIQFGMLLLAPVFNVLVDTSIIQFLKYVFRVIKTVQLSLKIAQIMLPSGMEIPVSNVFYQAIGTMIQADVKIVYQELTTIMQ
jgi:hypothetical protein